MPTDPGSPGMKAELDQHSTGGYTASSFVSILTDGSPDRRLNPISQNKSKCRHVTKALPRVRPSCKARQSRDRP
eukprot:152793-Rhodomonas_salina.1